MAAGALFNSCTFQSPLGWLKLVSDGTALTALHFSTHLAATGAGDAVLAEACCQLEAYFNGKLRHFTVPLKPQGSLFQHKTWHALQRIPFGAVWHYQQLAAAIGNGKASRAVGMANHKNPLPIIIPCHRVIGKNGALTGYAGGLAHKAWLLRHEGITRLYQRP